MGEPARVYAEQLNSLNYGHPLWFPDPTPSEGEVNVGDVGFLDDGRFCRIFNIFEEEDHPLNALGVPEDFVRFQLSGKHLMLEKKNYLSAGIYANQAVRTFTITPQITGPTLGVGTQVRASYGFSCSQDEGAFLLLSDGASIKKVYHSETLEKYIAKNHRSWYRFITQKLDFKCELNDVLCIYGCIKTHAWTTAALSRTNKSHEGNIHGQCTPAASIGFHIQVSEESHMKLIHHSGPEQEYPLHLPAEALGREDQCVFIAFYKVKYPFLSGPKTIQGQAGADVFSQRRSEVGERMSNALDDGLEPQSEDEPMVQTVPRSLKTPLLLDNLLDRMLDHTDAEIVLASHDDLYSLPVYNGLKPGPSNDDVHDYLRTFIPDIKVDDGAGTLKSPSDSIRYDTDPTVPRARSDDKVSLMKRRPTSSSAAAEVQAASKYRGEQSQVLRVSNTVSPDQWRVRLHNILQRSYGTGALTWNLYQESAQHTSPWTAIALINGVEYGRGRGWQQAEAKEAASRVAYEQVNQALRSQAGE